MFLAPLFLIGLLAIGVPIWLHRVARANPTQRAIQRLVGGDQELMRTNVGRGLAQ